MRYRTKRLFLALLLVATTAVVAAPAASADTRYHVGDHIEAYDT